MILVNTTKLDTKTLRKELYRAAKWADVCVEDVYVQVNNGIRTRFWGKIYKANWIRRKGKYTFVKGYIKLYVHPGRTLEDVVATWVHELSHLKDYREHTMYGRRVPYGKERRADNLKQKWLESQREVRTCGKKTAKGNRAGGSCPNDKGYQS